MSEFGKGSILPTLNPDDLYSNTIQVQDEHGNYYLRIRMERVYYPYSKETLLCAAKTELTHARVNVMLDGKIIYVGFFWRGGLDENDQPIQLDRTIHYLKDVILDDACDDFDNMGIESDDIAFVADF